MSMTPSPPPVPWRVLHSLPPNPWAPSLLSWSFFRYQTLGTYSHILILAAAHFPPTGRALPELCLCLVKKPQKTGRVLMVVALAKCCIVPLQLQRRRNNLAIRMQGFLPKCPWKWGYSVIRNLRPTRLKGWAEMGIPGSTLQIWTLGI